MKKAKLLELAAVRTRTVTVEGLAVLVREVGAAEFASYGEALKDETGKGKVNATAMLLSSCIVEEDGTQVYSIAEAATLARSARVAMPIVNAIMELSGFGDSKGDAPPGQPDAS